MKFLLTILMVLIFHFCNAQNFLSYYLKGKIYDEEGKTMPNSEFILESNFLKRSFVTDNNGNYFVEVIYVIGCRNDIESDRANNLDSLTISSSEGSMRIKFEWEKYYRKDSEQNAHSILTEYKGHNLVETKDLYLSEHTYLQTGPPYSIDGNLARQKLQEYNSLPYLDSLALGASMRYSRRTEPPDTLSIDERANFIRSVWYKLKDGKEYIIKEDNPLREYKFLQSEIERHFTTILMITELRNRPLSYLFSENCLGDCKNIAEIKQIDKSIYLFPFNKELYDRYLRLNVDSNNIIKDVVYEYPEYPLIRY